MVDQPLQHQRATRGFESSFAHLCAELERIELLVRIQAFRAREVAGDDPLRGLTISEEDVEALFRTPLGMPHWSNAPEMQELSALERHLDNQLHEIDTRCEAALEHGIQLRLYGLAERLRLCRFDLDVLLLGLASEIDTRYERLFAYLQDDVTRKRPGVDMALGLLCSSFEERLAARARFSATAPLLRHGLLQLIADPPNSQPTLLGSTIKVDPHLVEWLLGSDELDPRLVAHVRVLPPRADIDPTSLPAVLVARLNAPGAEDALIYLHGPPASDPSSTAEALGAALGVPVLVLDGISLPPGGKGDAESLVRLWLREALLRGALPYWCDFDVTKEPESRDRTALLRVLEEYRCAIVLSGDDFSRPTTPGSTRSVVRVAIELPRARERAQAWAEALAEVLSHSESPRIEQLARFVSRYRLSGEQIRRAAAVALDLARTRDPAAPRITTADLVEASQLISRRPVSHLAHRLTSPHSWDDLVLPETHISHLREICDHVRYRDLVFDDWGFAEKLSTGKGLSILFAGPPGTGKTMSAGIMARELGLEIYQIDLSSVVSKYIGETEKHLAQLFDEAEGSGAVLFFDEADALFGKRTEVKDSHDRYANLETSYLLQRIETYEGMVILASNFRRNLDDAFLRRFHFIIQYRVPDETQRRRLWEKIWPQGVPRAPDLDLDLMAQRFELAGGHIRNIALAASFLAASRDRPVTQAMLLHATRREYQKLGRRVEEILFRV